MVEKTRTKQFKICSLDIHAVTAIKTVSSQSLQAILSRMKIEYVMGFPNEIYAMALFDEICENRQLILEMLPKDILLFLIKIWESDSIEIGTQHQDYMRYLSMFGFVFPKKGDLFSGEPDTIYYITDMKEQFYFYLKSHSSYRIMDRFEEQEKLIQGLIYCYGLVEIRTFYNNYLKIAPEENISYERFDHFLKCRSSLWGTGSFLKTTDGQTEYFQHIHVENAEETLKELFIHKELPYCIPDREWLIEFGKNGGIDRNWKGLSDLITLFSEELQMGYYKTTVFVRALINTIQNGCSKDTLYSKAETISFENEKQRERERRALDCLFDCVPLFPLKGNNRTFCDRVIYEKQLKKKRKLFTMIQGGKV